jgi:hypothetical protein
VASMTLPPAVRLGSPTPSWLGLPSDGFDNGTGDDVVELAALAGLELDEAQTLVLRAALSEKANGTWAAFIVWWLMGRQNGKGSGLEARQLAGLTLLPDKFAIHTAHELKTTQEHFLRMQQLIEGCPEIERQVLRIRTGKGDEAIEMRNGHRLRFISRSGGSGRGFAGVDALYLDEAMFLTAGIMQAIFSTMAAKSRRGNPQMWLCGSAPYGDRPDQAWAHAQVAMLRSERRPANTLYVDWGTAPPTVDEVLAAGSLDAAVAMLVQDKDRWYATNPALGVRITEEFLEQELATLGPWGFAVERLGLVIPPEADNRSGVDLERWVSLAGTFELGAGAVVAVDVDEAGARGTAVASADVEIAGARRRAVEVVEQGGVGQLVAWVARQDAGVVSTVVVAGDGQARMIGPLLVAAGCSVPVVMRTSVEVASDEAQFVSQVDSGVLVHRGDVRLRASILAAEQRPMGDRWRWSRRMSHGDATALIAAAIAAAHAGVVTPQSFAY